MLILYFQTVYHVNLWLGDENPHHKRKALDSTTPYLHLNTTEESLYMGRADECRPFGHSRLLFIDMRFSPFAPVGHTKALIQNCPFTAAPDWGKTSMWILTARQRQCGRPVVEFSC